MSLTNAFKMSKQYILNKGGFRRYGNEQALLAFPSFFIKAAKELLPVLDENHIELSNIFFKVLRIFFS